jgi:protein-disulfide reductase (glutathione)
MPTYDAGSEMPMFNFKSVMAAVLLALCAPLLASAKVPELADVWNGAEINWRDLKSGIYEASTTKKTAIMVFHAPWCSACKQYREVFKNRDVVEASKKFVMILIDADADKMANGAFSPDGTYVPRTLFLNPDGDVLTDFVSKDPKYPHSISVESPDELLSLMRKAANAEPAPVAPAGENRT